MRANAADPATIVIVHESAAVLELIEQALRDRGHLVFATRKPFEAFDVIRRVQVDLVILEDAERDVQQGLGRDLRSIQPRLAVIYLGREPVSLNRLADGGVE
jgi:PleD family two-component response regulator